MTAELPKSIENMKKYIYTGAHGDRGGIYQILSLLFLFFMRIKIIFSYQQRVIFGAQV